MSNHKKIDWLRWHKRKMWIRINCAILSAILLITLLLQYPIICNAAESQTRALNKLCDSFFMNEFYTISGATDYYPSYDLSTLDYYATNDSYNYYDGIKDLFENAQFNINFNSSTGWGIFTSQEYSDKLIIVFCTKFNFSVNRSQGTYPFVIMGSSSYYYYDTTNHTLSSSYSFGGSTSNSDLTILGKYLVGNTQITYYNSQGQKVADNINYLLDENNVGYGSGGFNVSQPNSDIANHLQLYDKSSMYLVPQSMSSGTFYIYPNIDSFQNTNKNNFSLLLNVSATYNVSYNNGGSYVVKYNGSSLRNYYDIGVSASSWGGSHQFNIPLSEAIGGFQFPLVTINDSIITNNGTSITPMASGLSQSAADANFIKPILQAIGGSTFAGVQIDVSHIVENGWDIILNGCDYHFELYLKNNITNVVSSNPCIVYDYNFVTGSGSINYDNLSDNDKVKNATDNDTVPPEYQYDNNTPNYPDTYKPSNNDNSSNNTVNPTNNNNVTNGDYSPSVVNNNSIVVTKNSDLPSGLMNKFTSIIHNEKYNTVRNVDSIIEANGYVELCNDTLSSIPQPIWDMWILAIRAFLGICISAFFLKILINWAT